MEKTKNRAMIGCAIFLCLVMTVIFVRFFTVKVCTKIHSDNTYVQTMLQALAGFPDAANTEVPPTLKSKAIDWATLYPFEDAEEQQQKFPVEKSFLQKKLEKINEKVNYIRRGSESWTTSYLPGYVKSSEWANMFKRLIGWNIANIRGNNSVVQIEDGQLTYFERRKNTTTVAEAVTDFARYCKAHGAFFVYVAAPDKIGRKDVKYSGTIDFSNQNTDDFLEILNDHGINYIDLRKNIEAEGIVQRNLFFKTDHHWLPETGLWAARIVAEYLNENGQLNGNLSLLNAENYRKEIYEKWFLGSHGRKVTLARATPDDFSLLYPKFETSLQLVIPNLSINQTGDFSITYNMHDIEPKDYYGKNTNSAYCYGRRPITSIDNFYADNNVKVLLIRDSFANSVAPFLSLECNHIDIVDPRQFTGSIKSLISKKAPDIIIVSYHNNALHEGIDFTTHTDSFDFR